MARYHLLLLNCVYVIMVSDILFYNVDLEQLFIKNIIIKVCVSARCSVKRFPPILGRLYLCLLCQIVSKLVMSFVHHTLAVFFCEDVP